MGIINEGGVHLVTRILKYANRSSILIRRIGLDCGRELESENLRLLR